MSFRGFENMLANEAFEGRIEVSPLVSYEGEGLVGQFQSEVVIKMPLIICRNLVYLLRVHLGLEIVYF